MLQPGFAADVTIFDAAVIGRGDEVVAHDMPEAGMRYVRASKGVDSVLVNGELAWSASAGYAQVRSGVIASG